MHLETRLHAGHLQRRGSVAITMGLSILTSIAAAGAAPVDDARLRAAASDRADWTTYGRDYTNQRFSPLDQINRQTVGALAPAWTFNDFPSVFIPKGVAHLDASKKFAAFLFQPEGYIKQLHAAPGHILGTDEIGRDMLARLAAGARSTLEMTFIASFTSLALGVLVGLVAGFYRGPAEQVLMRITDIFLSVPTVVSGLAIASVVGVGITGIVIVVTALFWAWTARVIYGEVLRLRTRVDMPSVIGGSPSHTVATVTGCAALKHLLAGP